MPIITHYYVLKILNAVRGNHQLHKFESKQTYKWKIAEQIPFSLEKKPLKKTFLKKKKSQYISKFFLTLPSLPSVPVPASSPPCLRWLEDIHSEMFSCFLSFFAQDCVRRQVRGPYAHDSHQTIPRLACRRRKLKLFWFWWDGRREWVSSDLPQKKLPLSHFDRKGALRKVGEVFSASFSCTDCFRRWANGKNSQLKKTPISTREHGHLLRIAAFPAIDRLV